MPSLYRLIVHPRAEAVSVEMPDLSVEVAAPKHLVERPRIGVHVVGNDRLRARGVVSAVLEECNRILNTSVFRDMQAH